MFHAVPSRDREKKYMYDNNWTNADFIDFAATTKASGVELHRSETICSLFWNHMVSGCWVQAVETSRQSLIF